MILSKKQGLISIFVLLNLFIGRLFQESLGATCFFELSVIAITGFLFWNIASQKMNKLSQQLKGLTTSKYFLLQSGLGFSAAFLHILFSQMVIVFLLVTVYHCTSSSFDFINASLTNNVAVNLFCYFSLLIFFHFEKVGGQKKTSDSENEKKQFIPVSKGAKKLMLDINDIMYIEASNNCIVIHSCKGKFVKYQTLKSFLDEVSDQSFKRTHRSYIVNLKYIDHIEKNRSGDGTVFLTNQDSIRMSRNYTSSLI